MSSQAAQPLTATPLSASILLGCGGASADAELLALGRALDSLLATYRALKAEDDAAAAPCRARQAEVLSERGRLTLADLVAIAEETGYAKRADAVTAFIDHCLGPVLDKIEAVQAHSLAGLVVKAKAAAWAWEHKRGVAPWEVDFEDAWALNLIDAVLALAHPLRPEA